MSGNLFDVLKWTKDTIGQEGVNRLRLKLVLHSVREKIYIDSVTPDTKCSQEYIALVLKTAEELSGKKCPVA